MSLLKHLPHGPTELTPVVQFHTDACAGAERPMPSASWEEIAQLAMKSARALRLLDMYIPLYVVFEI